MNEKPEAPKPPVSETKEMVPASTGKQLEPVPQEKSAVFLKPPVSDARRCPQAGCQQGNPHPSRNALYERIDAGNAAKLPRPELHRQLVEVIAETVVEQRLSTSKEQDQLATAVVDDMVGLGPLEPLLNDEAVTDIMVNGPFQIYVERKASWS
ncbi:MAG: hypothetical protein R3C97_13120 [Geminicoccaceae bacterium]